MVVGAVVFLIGAGCASKPSVVQVETQRPASVQTSERAQPKSVAETAEVNDAQAEAPEVKSVDVLARMSGALWRLERWVENGKERSWPAPVTLRWADGGGVSGKAGVNQYSGSLGIAGDGHLTWSGQFITTRMAGSPEAMEAEARYLQILPKMERATVAGGRLVLEAADGGLRLEFVRQTETTPVRQG